MNNVRNTNNLSCISNQIVPDHFNKIQGDNMRTKLNKLFLMLIFSAFVIGSWAAVSDYIFASSTGTYTEISGGTILLAGVPAEDDQSFNAIPLGFSFDYDGMAYTTISIAENGFLAMGDEVVTNNLAISSTSGTNNVIVPLNRDLTSRDDGELMYLLSGTAPNRVFTVQWKNFRRDISLAMNDELNFQIQLHEAGNEIRFVYGDSNVLTVNPAATVQVGLRGASNDDYSNRSTLTDWTATEAGTTNTSYCRLSADVFPNEGLTFSFSTQQQSNPPAPAEMPSPEDMATEVSIQTMLAWEPGDGDVTGYKVYLGTNTPPTNIVDEEIVSNTEYNIAEELDYETQYYWQIVPFNDDGDAADCPIWSFATEEEPANDLYPPSNLQAQVMGTDVHLSWNAPEPPPTGEWITWCDTATAMSDGIGTGQPAVFDVAHRFDATDLAGFQGSTLTHVKFVPNEANCTYTVKIWTGTSASQPSTLVHAQAVAAPVIGEWNEVELTTPVPIPATGELWFGYEADTTTGHPAGCDAGPEVAGKGNMINFNGWDELTALNDALTYNWSIQGYVDHELDRPMMPVAIAEAPRAVQTGVFSAQENLTARVAAATNSTREQLGYKLYRDDVLVATIDDPATLEYIDAGLELGTYSYTLTANYDEGESIPAGPVVVTVEDLPAPTDLAATVEGNDVTLDWESPVPPLEGEWISWSDNANLGNSIGTDAAANFDVAHRYAADDLTEYVGGTLAQMKFVPMYADCVYTVKIWTGGTDTAPGAMVHSQVVNTPVIEDWTLVILNNPIPIEAGQALWIGYNVNTQGGFPAGCDNGPQIEGKGNMMNFGGWTTLSQVNDTLTYNWLIQGFIAQGQTLKGITLPALTELPLPAPSAQLSNKVQTPTRNHERAVLLGYKIYRDGAEIHQISDPDLTTYADMDLPNGEYVYGVSAVYNAGESMPATIDVTVNLELAEAVLEDSFEDYADFATEFAPWTLLDQDNSATYGFSEISFPGSESAMAYIVFNPSQTVPPITGMDPYEGDRMAASFAAVEPPNNDWMITPRINLGTNSAVKFYAKSHTSDYGLERFRVGVSTMAVIIPQGFQYVTGAADVEAPTTWTEYIYDLSAYDGQDVYIAIRCVSDDAFVFYVDNFSVHTDGGSSSEDPTAPVLQTELKGNYPNPFNPTTTIRYSVKEAGPVEIEIYNVKGQLVKQLLQEDKAAGEHTVIWNGTDQNNQAVSTGVYFYKMNAGKYSSTRKMIMMK